MNQVALAAASAKARWATAISTSLKESHAFEAAYQLVTTADVSSTASALYENVAEPFLVNLMLLFTNPIEFIIIVLQSILSPLALTAGLQFMKFLGAKLAIDLSNKRLKEVTPDFIKKHEHLLKLAMNGTLTFFLPKSSIFELYFKRLQ